jgi:nitrogen fixation protein NifU and related proteins
MSPYSDVVLDHWRHPRNYGSLEAPDFAHEDFNPLCGDRVRIEVVLAEDGTVKEARFRGDLCMIAKASSSILTEMIVGSSVESVLDLPQERLTDALHTELSASRVHCAELPLNVLKSALKSK